jgi:hypothetical protein
MDTSTTGTTRLPLPAGESAGEREYAEFVARLSARNPAVTQNMEQLQQKTLQLERIC